MVYQVSLKKRVLKALEDINEPYYSKIKEAIYSLADNPRPQGYKKLKGRDGYRIRVADYRIIYDIFDNILVVDVATVNSGTAIFRELYEEKLLFLYQMTYIETSNDIAHGKTESSGKNYKGFPTQAI